jgi:hypothetical protein
MFDDNEGLGNGFWCKSLFKFELWSLNGNWNWIVNV